MQTALNDNVLNVVEHPLHIVLIRGACTVRINVLLRKIPVLGLKLLFNESITSIKVRSGSSIFREAVCQRFLCNLLLEQIPFVQKEDKRRGQEPPRITNLLEQTECLVHHDHIVVLQQALIITR